MYSIILRADFKISLGMGADRADLRGGGSHHTVTAVPALPDLDLALLGDLPGLHIAEQGPVALLVVLFNLRHRPELRGRLSAVEPMPAGSLNHILARSFSLPAVFGNRAAICTKPSFLALDTK